VPGEQIKIYNGPKPSKKCSSCGTVITIGDKYWRGIDGVTRACLPCGSRIRGDRTYEAARAAGEARAATAADRLEHRRARRDAAIRGDTLA
jgi:hypothetical protein